MHPPSVLHVFNLSVLLPFQTFLWLRPYLGVCKLLQSHFIKHTATDALHCFFIFLGGPQQRKGRPCLHFPRGCLTLFFSRWSGLSCKLARVGMGWHRKWLPEPREGFRPIPFPVKHPPRGKERQDIRDKTHNCQKKQLDSHFI